MAQRLIEAHRVLKDTGVLVLHCDQTMQEYLKQLLNIIFGIDRRLNHIIWHYGKWSNVAKMFQKNHDDILVYSKTDSYTFNPMMRPRRKQKPYHTNVIDGQTQFLIYNKKAVSKDLIKKHEKKGHKIVYVEKEGVNEHDVWSFETDSSMNILNSQSKERRGWGTQKPEYLYSKLIRAFSNEGDVVFDPFAGCATTLLAAMKEGRRWIGCDISNEGVKLLDDGLHQAWEDIEGGKLFTHEIPKNYTLIDESGEPDKMPKRNTAVHVNPGYIYVMSNKYESKRNRYKIGKTVDLDDRLSEFNVAYSEKDGKYHYKIYTEDYGIVEKNIHDYLDDDRLEGEWFKCELKKIIEAIGKFAKPIS